MFRDEDWRQYRRVNERFADAVAQEAKTDDPVVLIQDYHFALLPRMVRERLPRATIITFWHIPWPNPESFGICPWRSEILEGLLGSTILGFHTRYHGHNFLEAVDRFLEARIEHETSTVSFGGRLTRVESFPISIAWPDGKRGQAGRGMPIAKCGPGSASGADHLVGLGVDRLDYTKGIVERLLAVERLFELHPEWIGKFTFVQIAAPSRSSLDEYQRFEAQVRATAAQINLRFGEAGYEPVRMLIEHHGSSSVNEHYRAADVCVVTSLHDGMNLVAKEYVAAREDERGRAGPEPVRRRGARIARSAYREPVPYRGSRRGDAPRAGDAGRRAARTHGQPAAAGARVQRVPLGGPDADGGGAAAAARTDQRAHRRNAGSDVTRDAHCSRTKAGPSCSDWLAGNTLYAFDFDGTLAPIVADPAQARAADRVTRPLAQLARLVPVAVVSGRAQRDLIERLPCEIAYLVGNHGNEGLPEEPDAAELEADLPALAREPRTATARAARGRACGSRTRDGRCRCTTGRRRIRPPRAPSCGRSRMRCCPSRP